MEKLGIKYVLGRNRHKKTPTDVRVFPIVLVNLFCRTFRHGHSLFTDTCALTAAGTLVEQFSPANMACLMQHDRFDIGRIKGEYPLHANAIGDLSYSETGRVTVTLLFDDITFERLDTLLVSLDDLVIYSDIITRLKGRKFFLAGQLFVYICDSVHNLNFRTAKVGEKV